MSLTSKPHAILPLMRHVTWLVLLAILLAAPLTPAARADGPAFLIKDINTNISPPSYRPRLSDLTAVGSTLYFVLEDPHNGQELWRADMTGTGAALVRDINPGLAGSYPYELTPINGTLFFGASAGDARGLWRTDGTAAGTMQIQGPSAQVEVMVARQTFLAVVAR